MIKSRVQVKTKGAVYRRNVRAEKFHDVNCADDGREQLLSRKIECDVVAMFVVEPLTAYSEAADLAPRVTAYFLSKAGRKAGNSLARIEQE